MRKRFLDVLMVAQAKGGSVLLDYAYQRRDHCKFGEKKPTCKKCPIHCYKPDMKKKMREAMRYAGPRMMWYHPIAAIKHLIREL